MAGDGPLAPPSIYHRRNGDWSQGICIPRERWGEPERTYPDESGRALRIFVHSDEWCSTRGWLHAYPGASRDDSLIEGVRELFRELRAQRKA